MKYRFQPNKVRAAILAPVAAISVFSMAVAQGADSEWTYDFESGTLGADWNFNTNSPVVSYGYYVPSGTEIASISKSGSTVFHSAAIHMDSYSIGVGDTLSMNLAWSPSFAQGIPVAGYNQIFQLGAMNVTDPWASATETFANGDGFWLAGREKSATAPTALGEWGTSTFDLWIHTDEAGSANPTTAEYLGEQVVNTFKQEVDGSISMKFLDIDLDLTMAVDGSFTYGVGIDQWEWTMLGAATSWVDEGDFVDYSGSRTHDLDSTSSLHPTLGYIVADSANEGVQSSFWSNTPIPEPATACLVGCASALLLRRRRR